jgi:uncharacterized membrane protein YjjB (DUF3815 family)
MNASRALKYVVIFAVGTLLVGSAHAEDWKVTGEFGCYGIGKTYQLDKGHLYWATALGSDVPRTMMWT